MTQNKLTALEKSHNWCIRIFAEAYNRNLKAEVYVGVESVPQEGWIRMCEPAVRDFDKWTFRLTRDMNE